MAEEIEQIDQAVAEHLMRAQNVPDIQESKHPEVTQAQIAAFAAERVEDFEDRRHLFNNLGNLAIKGVEDVTRVTDRREYHRDESGKPLKLEEGTERSVATAGDYLKFLRSVGGARYESIQRRAEMLKSYGEFAPVINRLRTELEDPATRSKHPALIGGGSNAMAFSISHEGKEYAVRVPGGKAANPKAIDSHLAGAVLGKGIPHLEQIVAASYEDGVTVAEMMPGKEMGNLTVDEIKQITDHQLSELVDTLVTAHQKGIEIDPKPSNFFYDPEAGFGIVDFHSSKVAGKTTADQELGQVVGWASVPIDLAGRYGKYNPDKTADDYANNLEIIKANLGVLQRYRVIVNNKLEGAERQKALEDIDSRMQSTQESVNNYSNPQWVSERINWEQERRSDKAELASKQKSPTDNWLTLDTV